jgi:short-chain fatty acids transporter
MLLLIIFLPLAMYWMGNQVESDILYLEAADKEDSIPTNNAITGAEQLDYSPILSTALGFVMIFIGFYKVLLAPLLNGQGFDWSFSFINPNYIIFMLFGFAILLHGSFFKFNQAVSKGIGGSAGIMIQFPFYAGIMGIMIGSGLVNVFSNVFVELSTATTFPVFTFFSAGLVNIFVPSGGGQWLVQGPILIEASQQLHVPIEKSIMALCYGDQITNMLQPFWALPLLGITGLKAKEILPYTVFLLLIGVLIFCSILLLF